MPKLRFMVVAVLVGALGAFGPLTASAQVPELPPEVEGPVGDAIGQLPSPLVPAIPGVGQASAEPGHAQASVVEIDGVVTVGKSETTSDSSKVTVLSVGGQDLLVREGDANGGTYTGQLAPAGGAIDQVNDTLCPGGPPASGEQQQCVLVLYSSATDTQATPSVTTHSARFRLLSVQTGQAPEGIVVGSTTADSFRLPLPEFLGGPKCTDIATSFLVSGTGTLAALILVNPGFPDSLASGLSINQAC